MEGQSNKKENLKEEFNALNKIFENYILGESLISRNDYRSLNTYLGESLSVVSGLREEDMNDRADVLEKLSVIAERKLVYFVIKMFLLISGEKEDMTKGNLEFVKEDVEMVRKDILPRLINKGMSIEEKDLEGATMQLEIKIAHNEAGLEFKK